MSAIAPVRTPLVALWALALFFALLFFGAPHAYADNRPPANAAEAEARQFCLTGGPENNTSARRGAIWFTGDSGNYYSIGVSVSATQTTATVWIRGSVYSCQQTGWVEVRATNIDAQGVYGSRLQFTPGSQTLNRGAVSGDHNWTTQGGSVPATFNVSGLAMNNQNGPDSQTINVDLYRCYSSRSSPGGAWSPSANCYAQSVPITITRERAPQPLRVQPYTRVDGAAGGTSYINPSQRAQFVGFTRVSDYDGRDSTIQARVERELNNNGSWDNIHRGSYTASSNGDRTIWGAYDIGPGTTQGGNLRSPDNIPANASQICYRTRVESASNSAVVVSNPSAEACARVRAGTTSAATSVTPATIEPGSGEVANLNGGMTTTGFRDWNGTTEDNYTITCNYTITITPGTGTGNNNGTIGGGASSGSCDQTISGNGTLTPVTRTYSTTTSTRIGTRVCLRVTIGAADAAFLGTTSSENCTTTAAKPYLKIAAGDVFAGKGFAPTTQACTATATARIVSWNRGDVANNGQWRGAGTTYAAYATGTIDGFASSQFAPGTAATPYPNEPKGLTFANVASTGTWGGSYQGATCIPDYYGTKPTGSTSYSGATWDASAWNSANAAASSPTNPDGTVAYTKTGNLTIAAGTINAGSNILLYVQGDVYLSGNITAANPTIAAGATNAVLETPGFLLVATGNIYIRSDVSQLYGSFAAQPTSATLGGNIYTCASALGTPLNLSATNYAVCNQQLVITGGLAAKKVHLLRTYGSLSRDVNGGQTIASAGSTGYQNAAEVIIYNPVLWLRRLTGTNGGSSGGTTYDAMTTLPPVL